MKHHSKKIISNITITLWLIGIIFSIPPTAEAVWGIGDLPLDVGNLAPNAAGAASEAGSLGENIAAALKEFGLDTAAYMAGQALNEQMVNKTIEWVTSGFDGNPFYVEDQGSFMDEIGDMEVLSLFSDIENIEFDTSSFEGSFEQFTEMDTSTIMGIIENDKKPIEDKLQPTIEPDELENFQNDFEQGGWETWEKLAQPSNNPIGRDKIIKQEYQKQVTEAQKTAEQELAQNDGFQNQKECLATSENSIFDDFDFSDYGFEIEHNNFSINNDPECERYSTETPGQTAKDSTNRATGSQFESIPHIDELSEIASQALGNMLIGLTNQGLAAIGNSGGTSETPSESGITYLGSEFADDITASDGTVDWMSSPTQTINLEIELPEAIRLTGLATAYLEETVSAHSKYLPIIIDLDYLMPGPDLGWAERLQDYWTDRSTREQMYIARKTDINEVRDQNFNTLKRQFAMSVQQEQQYIQDSRGRVLPLTLDSAVQGYINNVADLGREAKKHREALVKMRNLHLQLVDMKKSIEADMGLDYPEGSYDPDTDSWNQGEWMTPEEWTTWKSEGVIDGTPQTNTDGTLVEAVRVREEIRGVFLGMQRALPAASSLSRLRNDRNSARFTIKELNRLLREMEEFWVENYRITEDGEDYDYWEDLYSWFLDYVDNADLGTSNLGVVLNQYDNHGHSTLYPLSGRIDNDKEYGGPWPWGNWLPNPNSWPSTFPGFETNGVLEQYLDTELGVVGKLREIEKNTNTDFASRRKFYSIPVSIGHFLRTPWNGLLRDREKRLYCGFQISPRNVISNKLGAGNTGVNRYERIWCSESYNGEEASGVGDWYRATSFDYEKKYDPELAGVLIGI